MPTCTTRSSSFGRPRKSFAACLPALFDEDGHLPEEMFGLATTRLEQAFANVAEQLTAAQEFLTTALPWFAKGNESPLPKFRYRTLYRTSAVLLASTCHELAYSIVDAVILDLSSQTSAPFSGLSQSGLSRLTDNGLLQESFTNLSSEKWEWPLIDAYHKRHRRLLTQLRREFLRAWAEGPFEASESNELTTGDLWALQETSKTNMPCAQRDTYFFKQSQVGKRPAQIAKEWNADWKQQMDNSPRCS